MNVEITFVRTRRFETIPVALGRGFVVFNPVKATPATLRSSAGMRASSPSYDADRTNDGHRGKGRKRGWNFQRTRATIRGNIAL